MGYYTEYDITITPDDIGEIITQIRENNEWIRHAVDSFGNNWDSEVTWYKHEKDMRKISQQYPDVLFDLHGIGEDNDDEWHKYFKNGKMQICKVQNTFEPYDENKLK